MRKHDVVPLARDGRVESERPWLAAEGVGEIGDGALPAGPQVGRYDLAGPEIGQWWLIGQRQGGVHHPADVGRGDVQAPGTGLQLVTQPANLGPQVLLRSEHRRLRG